MAEDQQPVTRGELDKQLQAFEERLTAFIERSQAAAIDRAEERLTVLIRDVETKLLGAYFSYSEYGKIEFAKLKADTGNANRAAELRFENLDSRITKLENKWLRGEQPPTP